MKLKAAPNILGSATTFPHVANLVGWLDKTLPQPTKADYCQSALVMLPTATHCLDSSFFRAWQK